VIVAKYCVGDLLYDPVTKRIWRVEDRNPIMYFLVGSGNSGRLDWVVDYIEDIDLILEPLCY
jgi:hypothetical protein